MTLTARSHPGVTRPWVGEEQQTVTKDVTMFVIFWSTKQERTADLDVSDPWKEKVSAGVDNEEDDLRGLGGVSWGGGGGTFCQFSS